MSYLTPDALPDNTLCRALLIPDDPDWLALVTGALSELTHAYNFEQFGTLTPEETAERFLTMITEMNGGCPPVNEFILLQEQKASGNAGGDFNSGSFLTRALSHEVFDTANRCSLASNEFTLQPGKYLISATACAVECGANQLRLWNVTDSTELALGQNSFAYLGAGGPVAVIATVIGYVALSSAKTFRLEHRCQTTRTFYGRGMNAGWGTEVYANVLIRVTE